MNGLELLDRWISNKVRNWSSRLSGESHSPELLEIRRELLNDLRDKIQPKGGGKFAFSYAVVQVQLAAADDAQKQLLESNFAGNTDLQQDFCALLAEVGCAPPQGFSVQVTVIEDPALATTPRPFRIDYSTRRGSGPALAEVARPVAILTVLRGEAEPRELVIHSDKTYLGRSKEVVSETGSLRRRNDIAFAETEGAVSREHAFITYDRDTQTYRLHDSRNQRGTTVFRESRELRVPRGSVRGLELRSGDEIHLGAARVKFELPGPGIL